MMNLRHSLMLLLFVFAPYSIHAQQRPLKPVTSEGHLINQIEAQLRLDIAGLTDPQATAWENNLRNMIEQLRRSNPPLGRGYLGRLEQKILDRVPVRRGIARLITPVVQEARQINVVAQEVVKHFAQKDLLTADQIALLKRIQEQLQQLEAQQRQAEELDTRGAELEQQAGALEQRLAQLEEQRRQLEAAQPAEAERIKKEQERIEREENEKIDELIKMMKDLGERQIKLETVRKALENTDNILKRLYEFLTINSEIDKETLEKIDLVATGLEFDEIQKWLVTKKNLIEKNSILSKFQKQQLNEKLDRISAEFKKVFDLKIEAEAKALARQVAEDITRELQKRESQINQLIKIEESMPELEDIPSIEKNKDQNDAWLIDEINNLIEEDTQSIQNLMKENVKVKRLRDRYKFTQNRINYLLSLISENNRQKVSANIAKMLQRLKNKIDIHEHAKKDLEDVDKQRIKDATSNLKAVENILPELKSAAAFSKYETQLERLYLEITALIHKLKARQRSHAEVLTEQRDNLYKKINDQELELSKKPEQKPLDESKWLDYVNKHLTEIMNAFNSFKKQGSIRTVPVTLANLDSLMRDIAGEIKNDELKNEITSLINDNKKTVWEEYLTYLQMQFATTQVKISPENLENTFSILDNLALALNNLGTATLINQDILRFFNEEKNKDILVIYKQTQQKIYDTLVDYYNKIIKTSVEKLKILMKNPEEKTNEINKLRDTISEALSRFTSLQKVLFDGKLLTGDQNRDLSKLKAF